MKPDTRYKIILSLLSVAFVAILLVIFIPGIFSGNTLPAPDPEPRTIRFSEYDWWVKSSDTPVGPGPNMFSDSNNNVWVDESGRLHMKIIHYGNYWQCAEIVSRESFGYGMYSFTLASDPATLNENVVLGLFTWDDRPEYAHREIDIEFSRWEKPENKNAQFVIQPWDFPGNIHRFDIQTNNSRSTHSFDWQSNRIIFTSSSRDCIPPSCKTDTIQEWEYSGNSIPHAGGENARINLWLISGKPPTDGKDTEFILEAFRFVPKLGHYYNHHLNQS